MQNRWIFIIILTIFLFGQSYGAYTSCLNKTEIGMDTSSILSGNVTNDHVIPIDITNTGITSTNIYFLANDESTTLDFNMEDTNIYWVEVTDTFSASTDTNIWLYSNCSDSGEKQSPEIYPSGYVAQFWFDDTLQDKNSQTTATMGAGTEAYTTGKFGKAYTATGFNDVINIDSIIDATELNTTTLTDISTTIWYKSTDSTDNMYLHSYYCHDGHASCNGYGYWYTYINSSEYPVSAQGDSTRVDLTHSTDTIDGTWQMHTTRFDDVQFQSDIDNLTDPEQQNDSGQGDTTGGGRWSIGGLWNTSTPSYTLYYNGEIDNVTYYNYSISDDEVELIYKAQNNDLITFGTTTAIEDVTAGYGYTIHKTGIIELKDESVGTQTTIDNWDWIIDGTKESDLQDYNHSPVGQLQDYNICLYVDDNDDSHNDISCGTVGTGDWEAPTSFATADTTTYATLSTITVTCTDNNSGCDHIRYWINGTGPTLADISSGTIDVNISGGGDWNFHWDTNDQGYLVSTNWEDTNTLQFTKFGQVQINIYDEETGNPLSTTATLDGNSQTGSTINFFLNNDFASTTSKYPITFTKTGYATRTYELDLNKYSTYTINFLMLDSDSNKGGNYQFKIFDENAISILTNAYVNVRLTSQSNRSIGRIQTDIQGLATFYMAYDQDAYNFYIEESDGTIHDYNAISLTVKKPLDEMTETTIDGNWSMTVTGLARIQHNNISDASKSFALYTNTYDTYRIWIDTNSTNDYYDRYYDYRREGIYDNSEADIADWNTLQPYLLKTTDGTEYTYTILREGGGFATSALVNIYKTMADGRKIVTSRTTDGEGKIIIHLKKGDTYWFEIYYKGQKRYIEGELIKDYAVYETQNTIYIEMNSIIANYVPIFLTYISPTYRTTAGYGTIILLNPFEQYYKIERYFNGTLITHISGNAIDVNHYWQMATQGTYNIKIYKRYSGMDDSYLALDINFIFENLDYNISDTERDANTMGFGITTTDETSQKTLFLIAFIGIIFISILARTTLDKGIETFFISNVMLGLFIGWFGAIGIIALCGGMWMLARLGKEALT